MSLKAVEHDVNIVNDLGDVIMWQEIEPGYYKGAIRELLPNEHWENTCLTVESPISLSRAKWNATRSGVKRTHVGLKFVSPHRYISWTLATHKRTKAQVVFINSHFVSGAYTKGKYFSTRWYRKSRWAFHFAVLQLMIKRFNAAGYSVVVGGDWNRHDVPNFTKDTVFVIRGTLDHLVWCPAPGGTTLHVLERKSYSTGALHLNTDHGPRMMRGPLEPGKAKIHALPSFSDIPEWTRKTGTTLPRLPKK